MRLPRIQEASKIGVVKQRYKSNERKRKSEDYWRGSIAAP